MESERKRTRRIGQSNERQFPLPLILRNSSWHQIRTFHCALYTNAQFAVTKYSCRRRNKYERKSGRLLLCYWLCLSHCLCWVLAAWVVGHGLCKSSSGSRSFTASTSQVTPQNYEILYENLENTPQKKERARKKKVMWAFGGAFPVSSNPPEVIALCRLPHDCSAKVH